MNKIEEVKELFIKEFDVVFNDLIETYDAEDEDGQEIIENLNEGMFGRAGTNKSINEAKTMEEIRKLCVDVFYENGYEKYQGIEFYGEVLEKVVVE
jgi:hypothetical protein